MPMSINDHLLHRQDQSINEDQQNQTKPECDIHENFDTTEYIRIKNTNIFV